MYEKLSEIMTTTFQVPPQELRPDATLGDLGLDSLELAELATIIEDFGVKVSDEELVDELTLGALSDLVTRLRAEASEAAAVAGAEA